MAKLNDIPPKIQSIIIVGLGVAITVALYFMMFKAISDQNDVDAKELAAKEADIAKLEPYQNKLADLNRSIEGLKQQLELQKRIVPDEKETENFIKLMQGEAAKSNIEIRRYSAKPVVTKEFYAEAPFDIEIDGPYYSVLDFFERVSKVERIVNISGLSMASVSKPAAAKVKRTYRYEPNESVVASCTATSYFSREPAAAAPPKPAGK